MTDVQACKEIYERFMREYVSAGEEFLDNGMTICEVKSHMLVLAESVKLSYKAWCIAQEVESGTNGLKSLSSMARTSA